MASVDLTGGNFGARPPDRQCGASRPIWGGRNWREGTSRWVWSWLRSWRLPWARRSQELARQ